MVATFSSIGKAAFPLNPMYSSGKTMRKVNYKETFATTGANGDQHVLAGPLSMDDRISRIYTHRMAALTTATDCDLGFFYKNSAGEYVICKTGGGDELWDGVSLATAVTTFLDVLTAKNSSLDNTKAIRDHLAMGPDQEPIGGVYLVLTMNVAQSAGGVVDLDIEIEEATTR